MLFLIVFLFFFSCVREINSDEVDSPYVPGCPRVTKFDTVIKAIMYWDDLLTVCFKNGNLEQLVLMYTNDSYFQNVEGIFQGREEIKTVMGEFFKAVDYEKINIKRLNIRVIDNCAATVNYHVSVPYASNSTVFMTFYGFLIWRNVDTSGTWKVWSDVVTPIS